MRIVLVIPTYNPGPALASLLSLVLGQSLPLDRILIIDSSSTDGSLQALPISEKVSVHVIDKKTFNHGKTRQLALNLVDAEIYIYLTQDAIPANFHAFEALIQCFEDPSVGCVYGRQLPHRGAGPLEAHLRYFNYPAQSALRSLADRKRLGIKTCSNSNSFSAYRKTTLEAVGGFPGRVILGEDVYVAANMLLAGWKVAYCAEAQVFHSHDYTIIEDFKRYFDVGVFHQQEHWIIDAFKSPVHIGKQYMKSELQYCIQQKTYGAMFSSILHCAIKWLGYKLGRHYQYLPIRIRQSFSMHSFYWNISGP